MVPECPLSNKPDGTVSASYRGGQVKLSPAGLSCLWPTAVENKNATGKLSSLFHRHLD